MPLSKYEFCENRCSESQYLLKVLSELTALSLLTPTNVQLHNCLASVKPASTRL
jgi:hypothetical protein